MRTNEPKVWWLGGSRLFWAGLLLCAACCRAAGADSGEVTTGPVSEWVRPVEWNEKEWARAGETAEGTRWLLYEVQFAPQRKERFTRIILRMQNPAGVQDSGNLSIGFSSSYQQLIIHQVTVRRNGQSRDELDRSKIRLIQPESELDSHLITGRKTALIVVDDLRVGDVLEYSYTTRGENPALGDHFSVRQMVQSGKSLLRQRIRVDWRSPRPLQVREHLVKATRAQTARADGQEYLWDFADLPPIEYEDSTPPEQEQTPYIELSDWETWAQVVEWALPLYAIGTEAAPADAVSQVDRWISSTPSPEERARLALQFVQDELRYTGLELGPASYRPTPPYETLRKRFGDCKGKTLLFCTLLKSMGIEARPALVNTYAGAAVTSRLPTPLAFDHVIAKVRFDGATVWVDPTIDHQGGLIRNRRVSPHGRALVIEPSTKDFELLPLPTQNDERFVQRTFFQISDYTSPVSMRVESTYLGARADHLRQQLAGMERSELSKRFVNYYAEYYPGIQEAAGLSVRDDRTNNAVQVTEQYRIADFWDHKPDEKRYEARFRADALISALTEPATRLRKQPLRLAFPMWCEQSIEVKLPSDDWSIPELKESVEHEAFDFRYHRKFQGRTLKLKYECRTLQPTIPAERVAGYLVKRGRMYELLHDQLQRDDPAESRLHWPTIVMSGLTALVAIGCSGLFWFFVRGQPKPVPLPAPGEDCKGLAGWLFLLAFGLVGTPVRIVHQLLAARQVYFSEQTWQTPLLAYELVGNIVLAVSFGLLCALFLGKRRVFPTTYIVVAGASVLFSWGDYFGASDQVNPAASAKQYGYSMGATVGFVIWTIYMQVSRRVKLTFTE